MKKTALVFGGTGALGQAVVRQLAKHQITTYFTYCRSEKRAVELQQDARCIGIKVNFEKLSTVQTLLDQLAKDNIQPSIFIHCAAFWQAKPLTEISIEDWDTMQRIQCQSAFIACQALSENMIQHKEGHIIFVGAFNTSQTIDLPTHFAATQGMLSAMAKSLAKSLGRSGIKVNAISPGILDAGISQHFDPQWIEDFKQYSALGRKGYAAEVSRVIIWLALQNTYLNGQVIPVNGGI